MSTSRRAWQMFEARAAAFFGARRKVLSGGAGRDDLGGSDSTHERLFIECKLRDRHTVHRIWDKARDLAKDYEPTMTPVVCLQEKNRPGFLVVVHSDDFAAVAAEYLAARDDEALERFEAAVRAKRLGLEEVTHPDP